MNVCRFIHETTSESIPQEVLQQARRCLLDIVGTGVAARGTDLSRIAHDFAAACFSGRGAVLWQDGREVSAPGAALANAATVDALDIHDGHSLTKGHAGAAVVPCVFATLNPSAGKLISGRELLTTIAVGYEIAIRAGIALHATVSDYHTSGAWNALGCAAVTARRLALSEAETLHALGTAEYHGPRSPMMRCIDHPTMLKDGSGWGAMCGVSAALLAARGFTGRPAATIEADGARRFWDDLGQRWEILRAYFKPHAVCRWAQPAVEGALALKRQHAIDNGRIAGIVVETFHEATRLVTRSPATTEEAQYSLSFPVAAALCSGRLGPEELLESGLTNPDVLRLTALIEIRECRQLSAEFPARRLAHVSITTDSGDTHHIRNVEARWEWDAPARDDELLQKFRWLAGRLPEHRREMLAKLLMSCAELPDTTLLNRELARPY